MAMLPQRSLFPPLAQTLPSSSLDSGCTVVSAWVFRIHMLWRARLGASLAPRSYPPQAICTSAFPSTAQGSGTPAHVRPADQASLPGWTSHLWSRQGPSTDSGHGSGSGSLANKTAPQNGCKEESFPGINCACGNSAPCNDRGRSSPCDDGTRPLPLLDNHTPPPYDGVLWSH